MSPKNIYMLPALRCPECRTEIAEKNLTCRNGHQFFFDGDALILLAEPFKSKLYNFLTSFQRVREKENKKITNPEILKKLPYSLSTNEWKWRQKSLDVVKKCLHGKSNLKILEAGGWNGWLSHHLDRMNHAVISIDYFIDEYDGLKAKKFYNGKWITVQMDVTDLDLIDEKFDVVICNHGLQFFEKPFSYIEAMKNKLNDNGFLLILGLTFYRNPSVKKLEIEAMKKYYREQYGFELFLNPTKGYFDFSDMEKMNERKITLIKMPGFLFKELPAMIFKSKPFYRYGIYRQNNN